MLTEEEFGGFALWYKAQRKNDDDFVGPPAPEELTEEELAKELEKNEADNDDDKDDA